MKKLFTTSILAAALVVALSASMALAAESHSKEPAKTGTTAPAATMTMGKGMCGGMMKSGGMMGAMRGQQGH